MTTLVRIFRFQIPCPSVDWAVPEGDHYDLRLIPERYTGYSGHDAHRVWRSIYEENCFGLTELNLLSAKAPSLMSLPDTMTEVLHEDGEESNAQCLEKRVYYKVVSGELCSPSALRLTLSKTSNLEVFMHLSRPTSAPNG